MDAHIPNVRPLVAALNDPTRTRISDPRRGTYHVAIATADVQEAAELGRALDALEVAFQGNYRRDQEGRPEKVFLAIYELDSLRRLLERLEGQLDQRRRDALELLVRARGPVARDVLRRIDNSVWQGKSYAYIAERMTELEVIDGMGRGWTPQKVKKVHKAHLRQLKQNKETSLQRAA